MIYVFVMALLGAVSTAIGLEPALAGGFGERLLLDAMSIHRSWFLLFGLPTLAAYGTALLLPKSRASWIYGIVLISVGLYSIVWIPVLGPLLGRWVQPETKKIFDKASEAPTELERDLPAAEYDESTPA